MCNVENKFIGILKVDSYVVFFKWVKPGFNALKHWTCYVSPSL